VFVVNHQTLTALIVDCWVHSGRYELPRRSAQQPICCATLAETGCAKWSSAACTAAAMLQVRPAYGSWLQHAGDEAACFHLQVRRVGGNKLCRLVAIFR